MCVWMCVDECEWVHVLYLSSHGLESLGAWVHVCVCACVCIGTCAPMHLPCTHAPAKIHALMHLPSYMHPCCHAPMHLSRYMHPCTQAPVKLHAFMHLPSYINVTCTHAPMHSCTCQVACTHAAMHHAPLKIHALMHLPSCMQPCSHAAMHLSSQGLEQWSPERRGPTGATLSCTLL